MQIDTKTFQVINSNGAGKWALRMGIAGLALSAIGLFINRPQFFHSYLTAFVFWLSIALGGLFFTILHHLVDAKWSVVLRRISESIMMILPLMAFFFVPIIFGINDLYHWAHQDQMSMDHLLQSKAPYLNTPFFLARAIGFFSIWFLLGHFLYRFSVEEDPKTNLELKQKRQRLSAPGMILFALSLTLASFDWLMSLDAHWFSTIFGVYVFSGTVLSILSFMTLIAIYLRKRGILTDTITVEHYYDLGKLLFAFTVFWAYIAFSQFFLIWYANIPEETVWFLHRWEGSWKYVTLSLVVGHFVVPFLVLLNREPKRSPMLLGIMSLWILAIHFIDLQWLVLPNLHHGGMHPSWLDLTTMMGIGGIFLWLFWRRLLSNPIVPIGDSNLEASIKFVNQ